MQSLVNKRGKRRGTVAKSNVAVVAEQKSVGRLSEYVRWIGSGKSKLYVKKTETEFQCRARIEISLPLRINQTTRFAAIDEHLKSLKVADFPLLSKAVEGSSECGREGFFYFARAIPDTILCNRSHAEII